MTTEALEFPGSGRWERDFAFLRKYGMEAMFKMLMFAATTTDDLRLLHESCFPEKARLLRDDLIRLEEFWKEYMRGTVRINKKNNLRWLLNTPPPEDGLTDYYLQKIKNNASHEYKGVSWSMYVFDSPFLANVIACGVSREKRYQEITRLDRVNTYNLLCSGVEYETGYFLLGCSVEIGCALSDDASLIMVRFPVAQRQLSEPLTHRILSQLPQYEWTGRNEDERWGNMGLLCFRIPSDGLLPCLSIEKNQLSDQHLATTLIRGMHDQGVGESNVITINNNSFIGSVVSRLVESGIPITNIFPFPAR